MPNYLSGLSGPSTLTGQSGQYGDMSADEIIRQMSRNGFTQEGVDLVYQLRGLGTAPRVPAGLIGNRPGAGRALISILDSDGNRVGTRTGEVGDFLNTFGIQAVDPYRTPSGISRLAGGVLGFAGAALGGPVWTAMTSGADLGNAALGNASSSSDLGPYGGIGTAAGGLYSALGGPGSYGARSGGGNVGGSDGGASGAVGGGMGWNWETILDYGIPLVGGLLERDGAKDAARESAAGAAAALAENRRQYDTSRADMMPWLEAGRGALGRLQDPTAFTASPSYNFVRDEGMRGIENSFAARGGAASGNALRRLAEFNAGLASQEHNNWWNQQAGLAGVGQTSAQNLGVLGANSANNAGGLMQQQANARASGIAGSTNALTNLLGNLSSVWSRRNQQAG